MRLVKTNWFGYETGHNYPNWVEWDRCLLMTSRPSSGSIVPSLGWSHSPKSIHLVTSWKSICQEILWEPFLTTTDFFLDVLNHTTVALDNCFWVTYFYVLISLGVTKDLLRWCCHHCCLGVQLGRAFDRIGEKSRTNWWIATLSWGTLP